MKFNLDFEDPTEISVSETDILEMTIWNGDLFKLESTGESIPNGYKIETELSP